MFEVQVWEYDGAPDGGGYYLHERRFFESVTSAIWYADDQAGEDGVYVGACVFTKGGAQRVHTAGMRFQYKDRTVVSAD